MKKLLSYTIAVILTVSLLSFKNTGDILMSLGLTPESANKSIISNLTGMDGFKLPYLKIAPEILTGGKTAAAKEVCAYIKIYCESSSFASDYANYRQSKKPSEEEIPQFDAEQLKEMKETANTWDEMAKDKSLPKEQRDEYKAMADDMKKTVAEAEDPLLEWKQNFPEDPSILVKRGLQDYLSLITSVDFNAQLTQPDEYNIRKFVNPVYESKSPQWKAIYRAGKEVNTVVEEFAKQWLSAGIKNGQPGFTSQIDAKPGVDTPRTADHTNIQDQTDNPSVKKETVTNKAKGMIKSLKNKVIKIP